MSKKNRYSLSDLKDNGLIEISPGVFQKKSNPQPRDLKKALANTDNRSFGLTAPKEDVYVNNLTTLRSKPYPITGNAMPFSTFTSKSILEIDGIISGLNGDKGLMRAHWSETKRMKEIYRKLIRNHIEQKKVFAHPGKVKIQFIGYKTHFMDWDNFCSSFKHVGDALVKEGVILDDNPAIVVSFVPEQLKCKRADQKVIVIIEDVQ